MSIIGPRMSHNYIKLSLNETVAEVQARLGEQYGILLEADDNPVTLIVSDDLEDLEGEQSLAEVVGRLAPGMITAVSETMEAFTQMPAFDAFYLGARGAIVYEMEHIAGILTDETIERYLQGEFEQSSEIKGLPFDTGLPGDITDNPLIMYCEEFNHRNQLKYFNRQKPQECQVKTPRPHPIRRRK